MLCIATTPGSAVESNDSMVCMIGGAGNWPSKTARTKSMPAIDAMTSVGVTPYSILAAVLSSMGVCPAARFMMMDIILNGERLSQRLTPHDWLSCPDLIRAFIALQRMD